MPWEPIPNFRVGAPAHTAGEWNALINDANFLFDAAGLERPGVTFLSERSGFYIAYISIPSATTSVVVPLPSPPAPGRAVMGFVYGKEMRRLLNFCVIRNGSGGTETQSVSINVSPNAIVTIAANGTLTIAHPGINLQSAGWFIVWTQ